jgi:hypothetical protein
MEYNYEDKSKVPDLQVFKEELIEDVLKSAFFQEKSKKKYNMLKLPIIAPPSMIRQQINNDVQKQTIMEKKFQYSEDTLKIFQDMVSSKKFKIGSTPGLSLDELKELSRMLGTYSSKKTGEIMKIDLINLSKIFMGGQVLY